MLSLLYSYIKYNADGLENQELHLSVYSENGRITSEIFLNPQISTSLTQVSCSKRTVYWSLYIKFFMVSFVLACHVLGTYAKFMYSPSFNYEWNHWLKTHHFSGRMLVMYSGDIGWTRATRCYLSYIKLYMKFYISFYQSISLFFKNHFNLVTRFKTIKPLRSRCYWIHENMRNMILHFASNLERKKLEMCSRSPGDKNDIIDLTLTSRHFTCIIMRYSRQSHSTVKLVKSRYETENSAELLRRKSINLIVERKLLKTRCHDKTRNIADASLHFI